jgi:G3E family GTPase
MTAPRKITTKKQVKLIFAGGFLGSGKTTALAAIARKLIQRGMKVGIVTNDQSENLVDTIIVKQMLDELGVPVEEVVSGCFCCKFDELIDHMEKILVHEPDVLLGEPVGSCTDFVAAVANPIKIHYKDAFWFAPFSTMVDPDRIRELMLGETDTPFPEEVSYLFLKQLEEADLIILNKIDLLEDAEQDRLKGSLEKKFSGTKVMTVSAKEDRGMEDWLDVLLSDRPGATTVLRQIDYDRYARAEAVLGWLNGAVRISTAEAFDAGEFLIRLAETIRDALRERNAGIGHLKFVMTSGGKSMWANLTHLEGEPTASDINLGKVKRGTLIVNARVQREPKELEVIVIDSINKVVSALGLQKEIIDLQCFSPAYPAPPYLHREVYPKCCK